jgi:lipocalin-like protein
MTRNQWVAIIAAGALTAGLLMSAGSGCAQSAKDLAGTWTWVGVETTRPDGRKLQPFGPTPRGHVVFDGRGGFAYLLTKPGRPKFSGSDRENGTAEENKATVQGTLAMSGTYSVSGNVLTFKIEASTYPNLEGIEQKRTIITLTAGELRYSNPAPTNAGGGTAVVVARRVN